MTEADLAADVAPTGGAAKALADARASLEEVTAWIAELAGRSGCAVLLRAAGRYAADAIRAWPR